MIVTRLERLARSNRDLLNTLAAITAKRAGFRLQHDTWADTTGPRTGVLCFLARTGEGTARAESRGVKLGRKPTLTHQQQLEAIKRLNAGRETQGEIARCYNASGRTISRLGTE